MGKTKYVLQEYGLTKKEAILYVALLKIGTCSVSRVSSFVNYPKSTCYGLLESLSKKLLVSSFVKEKKKFFKANGPKILLNELELKKEKIKSILLQLNKFQKLKMEKMSVYSFEGKERIKEINEQMLDSKEIRLIGRPDLFF